VQTSCRFSSAHKEIPTPQTHPKLTPNTPQTHPKHTQHPQDQLSNCVGLYVEDQLGQQFKDLVEFVKKAEQQQKRSAVPEGQPIPGYGPRESTPVMRDFSLRWKQAVGGMHAEVSRQFAGGVCGVSCGLERVWFGWVGFVAAAWQLLVVNCVLIVGQTTPAPRTHRASTNKPSNPPDEGVARDVLQASMTQLLLYYTRMLELLKRQGPEGTGLAREAVNIPAIMYEIKNLGLGRK